jgi:hypothetical protein
MNYQSLFSTKMKRDDVIKFVEKVTMASDGIIMRYDKLQKKDKQGIYYGQGSCLAQVGSVKIRIVYEDKQLIKIQTNNVTKLMSMKSEMKIILLESLHLTSSLNNSRGTNISIIEEVRPYLKFNHNIGVLVEQVYIGPIDFSDITFTFNINHNNDPTLKVKLAGAEMDVITFKPRYNNYRTDVQFVDDKNHDEIVESWVSNKRVDTKHFKTLFDNDYDWLLEKLKIRLCFLGKLNSKLNKIVVGEENQPAEISDDAVLSFFNGYERFFENEKLKNFEDVFNDIEYDDGLNDKVIEQNIQETEYYENQDPETYEDFVPYDREEIEVIRTYDMFRFIDDPGEIETSIDVNAFVKSIDYAEKSKENKYYEERTLFFDSIIDLFESKSKLSMAQWKMIPKAFVDKPYYKLFIQLGYEEYTDIDIDESLGF